MSGITFEITRPVSLTAHYIEVCAEVRYWEDANVNDSDDNEVILIPLRDGPVWKPIISLHDGKILNWPEGTNADIHYKVCDQGEYWLLNQSKQRIAKWKGHYVPNSILCVGDNGYGDYIIMSINDQGFIEDWEVPEIDGDEWDLIEAAA